MSGLYEEVWTYRPGDVPPITFTEYEWQCEMWPGTVIGAQTPP
jgi:hypothetical protein